MAPSILTNHLREYLPSTQGFFTIERIFLLAAWLLNFLVVVAEDCRRIPRGAATIAWWVLAWAIELWFLVAHGWRGFSAIVRARCFALLMWCLW